MFEAYPQIDYDRHNHRGRLKETFRFRTDITGYKAFIKGADLHYDGIVTGKPGYEWDFGTGALDTIAMVVSSLEHDILTDMIEKRVLPQKLRKQIDKEFRNQLKYWCKSRPFERQWRWVRWRMVRIYAQLKELL